MHKRRRNTPDEPPVWTIVANSDGTKTCTRCGHQLYEPCGGRAILLDDTDKATPCPNIYANQLKKHLGDEIAGVTHVKQSPLYDDKEGIDRTSDFLHIKTASWDALLPHLKLALGRKGTLFTYTILTDEAIKGTFLGLDDDPSDDDRLRKGLAYVLGPYDLVIIRLGFLGYKNKAAPGALMEALRMREAKDAAVWIVEESPYPFSHSYSYSPEVDAYIKHTFFEVTLSWNVQAASNGSTLRTASNVGINVDSSETSSAPRNYRSSSRQLPVVTDDLSDLSFGTAKKKTKSKGAFK